MKCKCGHWNRCPACQGWVCEVCGADLDTQANQEDLQERMQLRNELYKAQARIFAHILFGHEQL